MPSPRPDPERTPRASTGEWVAHRERGSLTLLRMMIFASLRLGRPFARCILYLIALYFFLFAPTAWRHSREFLRRALAREPTAVDWFRQVFTFASTILDRLFLVNARFELFEVSIEGEELMLAALQRGQGAFLIGSHLGSFEIMGAVGRRQPGLRVAMAMYEDNARKLNSMLQAMHASNPPEIISLGQMQSMLRLRECLDEGAFVGILADRTFAAQPAQIVSFLGRPASFPVGPMRAAAVLRRQVIFMAGLYRGGNRYHIIFEPLADFSNVRSSEREAAVRAAVERYAALLEKHCRKYPYNWFNFYDFWRNADAAASAAPGPARSPGEPV